MKNIILLSDGTGNSSAKLFKTNVWRMYQSLDLSPGSGQVACYNDGVGTSSFKPLAMLGGAFGFGLKRNVLQLYRYLCLTYQPEDRIYIFGFSRGAFTARVLAGLIAKEGVIQGLGEQELSRVLPLLYHHYHRNPPWRPPFWATYHGIRKRLPVYARQQQMLAGLTRAEPEIEFVGVWDTVAAYGTPLAELTRGVDRWVYPLSMYDRFLSPRVKVARHALALDDERDTFHPLLWDEVQQPLPPHKLQQVWFAGMHADVGGGYPDDAMSRHPFDWMFGEAQTAGLRFLPGAKERFTPPESRSAPMHDSRRGLGSYYRYQPRKIAANVDLPDPTSLIMQDPSRAARARLREVVVHHSVIDRIRSGIDHYAPVVLPTEFRVLQPNGTVTRFVETEAEKKTRVRGQKAIWNDVWRKRVNYFMVVGASIFLGLFPFFHVLVPDGICEGPACLMSPIIVQLERLLPAVLGYWIESFAQYPGTFLVVVACLVALWLRGNSLQTRIRDGMWRLWGHLHGKQAQQSPQQTPWIRRLRTNSWYQRSLRYVKWRMLPTAFGVSLLALIISGAVYVTSAPVLRMKVLVAEQDGGLCKEAGQRPGDGLFHVNLPCWDAQYTVRKGQKYRVDLDIKDPWMDGPVATNPQGFASGQIPGVGGYLALARRRSIEGNWFQPFLTIAPGSGGHSSHALQFQPAGRVFSATFKADKDGQIWLWVNHTVLDRLGRFSQRGYTGISGTADVKIVALDEVLTAEKATATASVAEAARRSAEAAQLAHR